MNRGHSSAGRALQWHCRGRGFDPPWLHHINMTNIKFIFPYLISIIITITGTLGIFSSYFYDFKDLDIPFYMITSSLFLSAISFFLSWYYANLFIRYKVLRKLNNFGLDSMNLDYRKISEKLASEKLNSLIDSLRSYEDYNFELLGFGIPFFLIFLSTAILSIILNHKIIPSYLCACSIATLIIKFANKIVSICDIRAFKNYYIPTINNLIHNSKGIQFFNSINFISDKIYQKAKNILKLTENDLSKTIWKAFFYTILIFLFLCVIYIIKLEYFSPNLFNISEVEVIFFTSVFFYTMFVVSLLRYIKITNIPNIDISNYVLKNEFPNSEKTIDKNNLFIAFHGVYFQDPTEFSDHSILNNLSLSVLPGEVVALTGENTLGISYIFDLILKFHTPQSGKIYIAGTPIDNISNSQIRSLIGVFDETFSLIKGSVLDNIKLITKDYKIITDIIEKVGLSDVLNDSLFDENENIIVSQETLFRIQIARIAIQKPKIVLINTPYNFDSQLSEEMFYDFLVSASKSKTVFVKTNNPTTIIYSDKILYLGNNESIFGSHADISSNKSYQEYIKKISKT